MSRISRNLVFKNGKYIHLSLNLDQPSFSGRMGGLLLFKVSNGFLNYIYSKYKQPRSNVPNIVSEIVYGQRGVVFLFPGNHIPKYRWSKKIGRKEVILRFFFFPRDLGWKKKPWQKKVIIEPQKVCIFSNFGLDTKFGWRFFFFTPPDPEGKKKP